MGISVLSILWEYLLRREFLKQFFLEQKITMLLKK